MPITLDRSERTVVVSCPCGFADITTSLSAAERCAVEHAYAAHRGDAGPLLDTIRQRTRRARVSSTPICRRAGGRSETWDS